MQELKFEENLYGRHIMNETTISKMQMLTDSIEEIIEELRLDGVPRSAGGYYNELGDYFKL